ncbi:DUF1080 domain-containing protein [Mucilaginibacter hurinus]|uniref:DUF1080 domain-containing protein n=1 Tax=Mucilaginibacter hurinus TaxID=2201324 RepID=A0A367GS26_9SPHI|nr:DUF1080 domain-containing protein [Mucilaginibacter hurinus]RCH55885.1 DUF1080 domain-containing protein [Mucilaginibacter hurinus]
MSHQSVFRKLLSLSLILLATYVCNAQDNQAIRWQQLFNGKDLTDWQIKIRYHNLGDNFNNTFRVEGGLMKVRYDANTDFNETFGHIFYKKPFSHYLLAVEYRFIGEQAKGGPGWAWRNSGIMFHGQDPATMAKDQDFPNSMEAQFLGGTGKGERPTANICTPGMQFVSDGKIIDQHCTNSRSKTFNGDQWVRVELLVLGDSLVVHYVNGEEVLRYEKPQTDPLPGKKEGKLVNSGTISLQSESHPIDFRVVEIVDLEEYSTKPVELKQVITSLLAEKRVAKQ